MESEVDSCFVSYQDGKWQVSYGFFESYDYLSENNWFLLVQVVNYWYELFVVLMYLFCVLLDWCIDDLMIFFLVLGGGVGLYLDQYDVFIIQGIGCWCWCVGEKVLMKQYCLYLDLLQVDFFEVIIDEEMELGDIFYILLGFLYEGYLLENLFNYLVGYCVLNVCELFSGFVDYVFQCELGSQCYVDLDVLFCDYLVDILLIEFDCLCEMMLGLIN